MILIKFKFFALSLNVQLSSAEKIEKPELPMHVKLTVSILQYILHLLPLKEEVLQMLVLRILNKGLHVIKDWEDELLPIIHKIWSPLCNRFAESEVPFITNHSFHLLMTMAKLSNDFIRSRTIEYVHT